jgi:hypothetical protein
MLRQTHVLALSSLSLTLLLTGCGGGTTDQIINSITPPALQDGPSGNVYGFFVQADEIADPIGNIGGMYLNVPSGEGHFDGRISFQFNSDCQHTNALTISGSKVFAALNAGLITGTLDAVTVTEPNNTFSGTFSGSYKRDNNNYTGKYNRNFFSSDDTKNVDGCVSYRVASKGTWALYTPDTVLPAGFNVTQTADLINWTFVNNATKAVIMVINPTAVAGSDNAIIRQIITPAALLTQNVVNSNVVRGQNDLIVVELFDANNNLVAFKTLTAKF